VVDTPGGVGGEERRSRDNHRDVSTTSDRPRIFHLIIGFCGAFALSWLFVMALVLSLKGGGQRDRSVVERSEGDPFSNAIAVSRSGPIISVTHDPVLNPSPLALDGESVENDFLLFVWFNLRGTIDVKERATFLGKYNSEEMNPEGYAVAVVGGPDGVRPTIYWQNKAGQGRWYTFASTVVEQGRWYLLAVTFRSQRYLGVHLAPHDPKARVEVLGGYDLGGQIVPSSPAELEVGAFPKSKFRGGIGPFGVLRGMDILNEAPKFLQSLARDPAAAIDRVEQSKIGLWADPAVDLSPRRLKIVEVGGGRNQ
jgi:hypothetical protein